MNDFTILQNQIYCYIKLKIIVGKLNVEISMLNFFINLKIFKQKLIPTISSICLMLKKVRKENVQLK